MSLLEFGYPRCYDCDKSILPNGESLPKSLRNFFCKCNASENQGNTTND